VQHLLDLLLLASAMHMHDIAIPRAHRETETDRFSISRKPTKGGFQ
jgi:hypothetical protein